MHALCCSFVHPAVRILTSLRVLANGTSQPYKHANHPMYVTWKLFSDVDLTLQVPANNQVQTLMKSW